MSDTIASPLPDKILQSPAASTPVNYIDRDRLRYCILDILQCFQKLVQTRDAELMHYALFSFNNFHRFITRMDVWCGIANGPPMEPPGTVPKPVGRYSS